MQIYYFFSCNAYQSSFFLTHNILCLKSAQNAFFVIVLILKRAATQKFAKQRSWRKATR